MDGATVSVWAKKRRSGLPFLAIRLNLPWLRGCFSTFKLVFAFSHFSR